MGGPSLPPPIAFGVVGRKSAPALSNYVLLRGAHSAAESFPLPPLVNACGNPPPRIDRKKGNFHLAEFQTKPDRSVYFLRVLRIRAVLSTESSIDQKVATVGKALISLRGAATHARNGGRGRPPLAQTSPKLVRRSGGILLPASVSIDRNSIVPRNKIPAKASQL